MNNAITQRLEQFQDVPQEFEPFDESKGAYLAVLQGLNDNRLNKKSCGCANLADAFQDEIKKTVTDYMSNLDNDTYNKIVNEAFQGKYDTATIALTPLMEKICMLGIKDRFLQYWNKYKLLIIISIVGLVIITRHFIKK